jgi:hypothetical protein
MTATSTDYSPAALQEAVGEAMLELSSQKILVSNKMSRKIVYLMGGLGNVLFQLNYLYNLRAAGISASADCTLLKNGFIAQRVLGWSDHRTLDILSGLQLLSDIDGQSRGHINILAGAVAKFFGRDVLSARYCGLVAPLIGAVSADHLFGYFHERNSINIEFVKKIRLGILELISTPEFSYVREALSFVGNEFVVHVRGGDYAHDAAFAISGEYYKKALSGQRKCYIVTNDKDFSRNIFKDIEVKYEFLETKTALEDFIFLALSESKILANSTFSWWAAELGGPNSNIIQKEPFFDHINGWHPDSKVSRQLVLHSNS